MFFLAFCLMAAGDWEAANICSPIEAFCSLRQFKQPAPLTFPHTHTRSLQGQIGSKRRMRVRLSTEVRMGVCSSSQKKRFHCVKFWLQSFFLFAGKYLRRIYWHQCRSMPRLGLMISKDHASDIMIFRQQDAQNYKCKFALDKTIAGKAAEKIASHWTDFFIPCWLSGWWIRGYNWFLKS